MQEGNEGALVANCNPQTRQAATAHNAHDVRSIAQRQRGYVNLA